MPNTITPTSVTIKVLQHTDNTIAGLRELTLYVKGPEYKRLPLDANVREPNPAKSRPYKEMKQTLVESPEKFFENNLGISVIATDVHIVNAKPNGEATVKLDFHSLLSFLSCKCDERHYHLLHRDASMLERVAIV